MRALADNATRTRLRLVPVTYAQACAFVDGRHRHHRPPRGHKYSIGVAAGDALVDVAMVDRLLPDGHTLELVGLATDGTTNACSKLYTAVWTAAKALGYRRLISHTQAAESGASPCTPPAGTSSRRCRLGRAGRRRAGPASTRAPQESPGTVSRGPPGTVSGHDRVSGARPAATADRGAA